MTIQIILDGGADVPSEMLNDEALIFIPMEVQMDGETLPPHIEIDAFYKMLREGKKPTTSSLSPYAYMEAFKKADAHDLVVLAISSGVSGTYQHALLAKTQYEALMQQGEVPDKHILVLDTKTASVGMTLLADRALQWMREGLHLEALSERLRSMIQRTYTTFYFDSVDMLIRGGRLDRLKGAVASFLNIKLIMHEVEGKIEVREKVRGSAQALKRFVEHIGTQVRHFDQKVLAVAHAHCEERARALIQEITDRYPFSRVLLTEIGPVIGSHTGEGGFVLAYEADTSL